MIRGQGEHHGNARHQALCCRAIKQIAHDGPADDDARAGGDALQGAHQPEVFDAGGKDATEGSQGEQGQGNQHHPATAEGIRKWHRATKAMTAKGSR